MRLAFIAAASLIALGGALQAQTIAAGDWPSYSRDPGAQRYSPLAQITPANVNSLKVAWTFHMTDGAPPGPGGQPARALASQSTPLVIGGIVYLSTPQGRIVALDGVSGKQVWSFVIPD